MGENGPSSKTSGASLNCICSCFTGLLRLDVSCQSSKAATMFMARASTELCRTAVQPIQATWPAPSSPVPRRKAVSPCLMGSPVRCALQSLLIKAHSGADGPVELASIRALLTIEEQRIFESALASVAAFERWRNSELVPYRRPNRMKRKFAASMSGGVATGTAASR